MLDLLRAFVSSVMVATLATSCARDPERAISATKESRSVPSSSLALPSAFGIAPDGVPNCNVVMSVPVMPGLSAKVDAAGVVHLVVGSYSQLPLASAVTMTKTTIDVTITPAGPAQQFCFVPLKVTGLASGKYEVVVTIPHAPRPTDTLRASVTVP